MVIPLIFFHYFVAYYWRTGGDDQSASVVEQDTKRPFSFAYYTSPIKFVRIHFIAMMLVACIVLRVVLFVTSTVASLHVGPDRFEV